jgi:hypothetical protein
MPPSLADCWTRWNRAGDHVNSLNEACQAIIKSNGYTFTADLKMSTPPGGGAALADQGRRRLRTPPLPITVTD